MHGDDDRPPSIETVSRSFQEFLDCYSEWKSSVGLKSVGSSFEILASMTDKLGRICRYVKHQERNDPKPDWPDGMTTEMVGLLSYMVMLKDEYGVDIAEGMAIELRKAVEQHGS